MGISVDDIKYDADCPQECLYRVFKRWKDKNVDVTWKRIERVCENFPDEFGQVKAHLREYLSSDEARKEYLSSDKARKEYLSKN